MRKQRYEEKREAGPALVTALEGVLALAAKALGVCALVVVVGRDRGEPGRERNLAERTR